MAFFFVVFTSFLPRIIRLCHLFFVSSVLHGGSVTFTVWKWCNPQCFHLPPGFWPMGGLGIVPVPHLTITSPLVNRLCSSRWNCRRCQPPHKGCRLAPASKLIIREKLRSERIISETTSTTCCLHRDRVQAKMSLGARGNSEMYVILNDLAQQVVLVVLIHQPLLKLSLFLFFCEQTFAIN